MAAPDIAVGLQGGGCLGKGQTVAMAFLVKLIGKPLWQFFTAAFGTSVGAINAACIALGIDPTHFFDSDAPVIFAHNWIDEVSEIVGAKYNPAKLKACLQSVFGNARLSDCKIKFGATAFECSSGRVVHFSSWEPSSQNQFRIVVGPDSGIFIWQVLMASTCAQLYFPEFTFTWNNMVFRCRDGGNTAVNAPDILAYTKMTKLGNPFKILSIGAGRPAWNFNFSGDPGAIEVVNETIQIVFPASENQSIALSQELLGSNHYRLDAVLPQDFAIDDATTETFALETAAWQSTMTQNQSALSEFLCLSA